jgi:hypothetical protein
VSVVEEEKERLREAAASNAEELKDAVGELAAAAQSQANCVLETGRWICLYGGFTVGLFLALRRGASARLAEKHRDE